MTTKPFLRLNFISQYYVSEQISMVDYKFDVTYYKKKKLLTSVQQFLLTGFYIFSTHTEILVLGLLICEMLI